MDYGDANEFVWLFRNPEMERAGYSTGELNTGCCKLRCDRTATTAVCGLVPEYAATKLGLPRVSLSCRSFKQVSYLEAHYINYKPPKDHSNFIWLYATTLL